jgi:hypothetical protein
LEGFLDGFLLGFFDGFLLGFFDGFLLGFLEGFLDGFFEGFLLGLRDGFLDGFFEGFLLGFFEGFFEGFLLGLRDGFLDGFFEGFFEGFLDGFFEGFLLGFFEGFLLGLPVDPPPPVGLSVPCIIPSHAHNNGNAAAVKHDPLNTDNWVPELTSPVLPNVASLQSLQLVKIFPLLSHPVYPLAGKVNVVLALNNPVGE